MLSQGVLGIYKLCPDCTLTTFVCTVHKLVYVVLCYAAHIWLSIPYSALSIDSIGHQAYSSSYKCAERPVAALADRQVVHQVQDQGQWHGARGGCMPFGFAGSVYVRLVELECFNLLNTPRDDSQVDIIHNICGWNRTKVPSEEWCSLLLTWRKRACLR